MNVVPFGNGAGLQVGWRTTRRKDGAASSRLVGSANGAQTPVKHLSNIRPFSSGLARSRHLRSIVLLRLPHSC